MTSGGAKGSSPTCSSGWAFGDQASDRVGLSQAEPRKGRAHGVDHIPLRPLVGAQREPQQLEPDPMFLEDTFAVAGGGEGGEFEHCGQVVWQLIGFQYQARGRVQALQPE